MIAVVLNSGDYFELGKYKLGTINIIPFKGLL